MDLSFCRLFYLMLILMLISVNSFAGSPDSLTKGCCRYLSPLPGASLVQPSTDIIIRFGEEMNPSLFTSRMIRIKGSLSGDHQGKIIYADDGITLIFRPDNVFSLGESVTVSINPGKDIDAAGILPSFSYSFRIIEKRVAPEKILTQAGQFIRELKNKNKAQGSNSTSSDPFSENVIDSLPPDFPVINLLQYDKPSPGQIFTAPFHLEMNQQFGYLMILENDARPVFYKRFDQLMLDFKPQPNGSLTYFNSGTGKYYEMNSKFEVVDSFECGNGYITDMHELMILPNGHALLIANDYEYVPMDTIVAGGDPNAVVLGNIIQELDNNKNVVFEWRSWDHFQITDATPDIDLTGSSIDYVHCNSIEEDTDGNLIISSRHMDEVTKINRQTGDIMWRLGGEYCQNNQFTFINDSTGFSHQHDARRISNGSLTLFDNGNLHSPQYSRGCEYQLDETNMTALLVQEYKNDPQTFTTATGSMRRTPNGNTLLGWGINDSPPSISELHPDQTTAWAVDFPPNVYSYRTFRETWKTDYFTVDADTINFTGTHPGSSDSMVIIISNDSDTMLTLNEIYCSDASFSIVESVPVYIPAHSDQNLTVKFQPAAEGEAEGWLHLGYNSYNELTGLAVYLHGTSDSTFTYVKAPANAAGFKLYQNYPNPFNPSTKISWSVPERCSQSLIVYDITGREAAVLLNEVKPAGNYEITFNGNGLASGVYFIRLRAGSFVSTKKILLMK